MKKFAALAALAILARLFALSAFAGDPPRQVPNQLTGSSSDPSIGAEPEFQLVIDSNGAARVNSPTANTHLQTIVNQTDTLESLLGDIRTAAQSLDTKVDVSLSTRATEATQLSVLGAVDAVEPKLDTVNANLVSLSNLLTGVQSRQDAQTTLLTAISSSVDQLEGYVDGLEALLATSNTNTGNTATSVASIDTKTSTIIGHVDGLEGLIGTTNSTLLTIDGHVDTLETLVAATNTKLDTANTNLGTIQTTLSAISGFVDQLEGFVDGIEGLLSTISTSLTTIIGHVDGIEGLLGTSNTNTGNTATSVASLDSKTANNYGAASGAIRTASQLGNSSGEADFGSGNVTAQTQRVVITTNQAPVQVRGSVANGVAPTANPVLIAGSDGTLTRTMLMDTSNRPVVAGGGVAGTPAGGVVSIQGVTGGQSMPANDITQHGLTTTMSGNLGAQADAAATTDTGTFSLISLFKRSLQGTTTLLAQTDALESRTGDVTETAPASDTASSGLNGRLQRIAQNLTTLIAKFATTTVNSLQRLNTVSSSDGQTGAAPPFHAGYISGLATDGNAYAPTIIPAIGTTTQYLFGVNERPSGASKYSAPIEIRQTAATALGSTVWAMRNAAASTKRVFIIAFALQMQFNGTNPVTRQILAYDLQRFSTATPTGGTAQTAHKRRSADAASQVTDIRFLNTGLTMTSVVFDADVIATYVCGSVDSASCPSQIYAKEEELAPGEGLALRLSVAAVVGQEVGGEVVWLEY